jgi:hypothetical protein
VLFAPGRVTGASGSSHHDGQAAVSHDAKRSLSVDDVRAAYAQVFLVVPRDSGTGRYVSYRVGRLEEDHPLAGLINENEHFFGYVLTNTMEASGLESVNGDPDQIRERVLERIQASTRLNEIVLPMAARHLASHGMELHGLEGTLRQDANDALTRFELDAATSVAARFFYPHEIGPGNKIQAHICAGINGLDDLQMPRHLALEAFVFSALWHDLRREGRGVRQEFMEELQRLAGLDLSSNPGIRLHRVQGAIWAHMARSRRVRRALLKEYARMERWLPFSLSTSRGTPDERQEND